MLGAAAAASPCRCEARTHTHRQHPHHSCCPTPSPFHTTSCSRFTHTRARARSHSISLFRPQVRFKPMHPAGHVLQVPESALGEVLRYRNASTRFDLLLRGRAVDKIIGIFTRQGTPVGGVGESGDACLDAAFGGEIFESTYGHAKKGPFKGLVPTLPPLPPEAPPLWGELGQPPLPRDPPTTPLLPHPPT